MSLKEKRDKVATEKLREYMGIEEPKKPKKSKKTREEMIDDFNQPIFDSIGITRRPKKLHHDRLAKRTSSFYWNEKGTICPKCGKIECDCSDKSKKSRYQIW